MLYSCILTWSRQISGEVGQARKRRPDEPESSDEPLDGLDGWFEQQPGPHQAQKAFDGVVQRLVLDLVHLRPVLLLALLAEDAPSVRSESRIEETELLKALDAYREDRVVVL